MPAMIYELTQLKDDVQRALLAGLPGAKNVRIVRLIGREGDEADSYEIEVAFER